MNGKLKNRILVFSFILSLLIAYKLAFSKTISLRKLYLNNEKESLSVADINKKLFQLTKQKTHNDSILKKYKNLTNSSFQNNLLQTINIISRENSLTVLSFNEPHYFIKDKARFANYQIKLSGSYENILKLLNKIEEEYKFGKLHSVNFEKKKDYKSGRKYLVVDFLLQRVNAPNPVD